MFPATSLSRLCAFSPVTFDELRRELSGAIDSATGAFRGNHAAVAHWDGPNEVVLQLDVPGYLESQLTVDVEDGVLRVSGHREMPQIAGELKHSEGQFGEFSRSFQLPETLDGGAVTAELANGVLTLVIPRKVSVKPSRIPVIARSQPAAASSQVS